MSRSRDVAQILGKTDATNTSNLALINTSSGVDSSEILTLIAANSSNVDSAKVITLVTANSSDLDSSLTTQLIDSNYIAFRIGGPFVDSAYVEANSLDSERTSSLIDSAYVQLRSGGGGGGGDYTVVSGAAHHTSDTTSTGGIGNMKIGFEAGKEITSANDQYNVYLGYRAGYRMGGDNNIGIGQNVMFGAAGGNPSTNTGARNLAIGSSVGQNITTANDNIMIGTDAGMVRQAGNVIIGHGMGLTTALSAHNGDNILIGRTLNPTATSAFKQYVIGNGLTSKGNYTFYLGGSSGVYNEQNHSAFQTTSDERIKTNVTNYTTGLTVLDQVNVKTYNYLSDSDIATAHPALADSAGLVHEGLDTEKTIVGVMAQELESLLPNTVTTRDNGIKSVNKDELFWVMLNSIKELKARVEALEDA